jgi:hypothetical protein
VTNSLFLQLVQWAAAIGLFAAVATLVALFVLALLKLIKDM